MNLMTNLTLASTSLTRYLRQYGTCPANLPMGTYSNMNQVFTQTIKPIALSASQYTPMTVKRFIDATKDIVTTNVNTSSKAAQHIISSVADETITIVANTRNLTENALKSGVRLGVTGVQKAGELLYNVIDDPDNFVLKASEAVETTLSAALSSTQDFLASDSGFLSYTKGSVLSATAVFVASVALAYFAVIQDVNYLYPAEDIQEQDRLPPVEGDSQSIFYPTNVSTNDRIITQSKRAKLKEKQKAALNQQGQGTIVLKPTPEEKVSQATNSKGNGVASKTEQKVEQETKNHASFRQRMSNAIGVAFAAIVEFFSNLPSAIASALSQFGSAMEQTKSTSSTHRATRQMRTSADMRV